MISVKSRNSIIKMAVFTKSLLDQKAVVFVAIQMPSLQKIPELHLQLWQLFLASSSLESSFKNCLKYAAIYNLI